MGMESAVTEATDTSTWWQRRRTRVSPTISTHKVVGVREAIESAGASQLYLPPYSPDFNPIECMWGKVKACLRSLSARSLDQLLKAFAIAIDSVSPSDCLRFFSLAGYDTSFMETL